MDFFHQADMGVADVFRGGVFIDTKHIIGFFFREIRRGCIAAFCRFPAFQPAMGEGPEGDQDTGGGGQAARYGQKQGSRPHTKGRDSQQGRLCLCRGGFQEKPVEPYRGR